MLTEQFRQYLNNNSERPWKVNQDGEYNKIHREVALNSIKFNP